MPVYVYECQKCKKVFEVRQTMMEPVYRYHYQGQMERREGYRETKFERWCDGDIHRIIQHTAIVFKGRGRTPRFFGRPT